MFQFAPWMVPAAMAGLGAVMGHQQKKADTRARQNEALLNMYAPLFGQQVTAMKPIQERVLPGAVSGGIHGYEMITSPEFGELFKDDTNLVSPKSGTGYGLGVDMPKKSVLDDAVYAPSLAGGYGMGLGLSSPMSMASSANMFNKDPYNFRLGIGNQEPVPETAKYFQPYAH